MMNTLTHRSFFSTTATPFMTALLFSLVMSLFQVAHAASTTGRNVNVVSVDQGTYRQISQRNWIEQNSQGQTVFSFQETQRDDWSVYLHDASRDVNIQLDLHTRKVMYNAGNDPRTPLYAITSAQ